MTSSNLSKNINVSIEDKFQMFIDSVTKKYTIDKDELIKLWNSHTESTGSTTVESLKKLTVPKLKNLCNQNGIKYKKNINNTAFTILNFNKQIRIFKRKSKAIAWQPSGDNRHGKTNRHTGNRNTEKGNQPSRLFILRPGTTGN